MQFSKKTSSVGANTKGIVIKSILGIVLISIIVFFISSIDFPAPNKAIEKIIQILAQIGPNMSLYWLYILFRIHVTNLKVQLLP